jgi:2-succinyl-5-enolpyruvyl-6-hydroxy-3-cyclohexene-1-carboxylate synthase
LDLFSQAFKQSEKIVFVIGQLPPNQELDNLLEKLLQMQQVVVLADVVSNQQHRSMVPNFDAIIQYADENLLNELAPDMLISTGGSLVSKALKNWLKNSQPTWHFRISEEAKPINTYGNLTHSIRCSIQLLLSRFLELDSINEVQPASYFLKWSQMSSKTKALQQTFFEDHKWSEPYVFALLLSALPSKAILHIGNSGSIRFASWLGLNGFSGKVFGNRGTSGIEGSVSTAVGAAIANPEQPVYLICGDLSFFYDSNALWYNTLPTNLKIIVMNNGGGKIFEWIEGPSKFPEYLDFFTTSHQRSISSLSAHFGIACITCNTLANFETAFNQLKQIRQSAVLELVFDSAINTEQIKKFKSIQLN